jgi:hypothetical protein
MVASTHKTPRILSAFALFALPASILAGPVALVADRDTSIFQENQNSAGADPDMYAGRTSTGFIRRALVRFDLSSIPSGSAITDVDLALELTNTNQFSGPRTISLWRLQADWGEGVSTGGSGFGSPPTPESATWIHRFYDTTSWGTAGGDFVPVASASTVVDNLGPYVWTSAAMIADVQGWLDEPTTNFGWMVRGDEVNLGVAKRFAAREHLNESFRPTLTVTFTPPQDCYANCDHSTTPPILNVEDFTCFINEFAAASSLTPAQQIVHYANCDHSTTQPVLNVEDFICFINEFAQGCP